MHCFETHLSCCQRVCYRFEVICFFIIIYLIIRLSYTTRVQNKWEALGDVILRSHHVQIRFPREKLNQFARPTKKCFKFTLLLESKFKPNYVLSLSCLPIARSMQQFSEILYVHQTHLVIICTLERLQDFVRTKNRQMEYLMCFNFVMKRILIEL